MVWLMLKVLFPLLAFSSAKFTIDDCFDRVYVLTKTKVKKIWIKHVKNTVSYQLWCTILTTVKCAFKDTTQVDNHSRQTVQQCTFYQRTICANFVNFTKGLVISCPNIRTVKE